MFVKAEARDEAGYYTVGIFTEPSRAEDYPAYIAHIEHLKAQPEPHRYLVLIVDTRHGVPPNGARSPRRAPTP